MASARRRSAGARARRRARDPARRPRRSAAGGRPMLLGSTRRPARRSASISATSRCASRSPTCPRRCSPSGAVELDVDPAGAGRARRGGRARREGAGRGGRRARPGRRRRMGGSGADRPRDGGRWRRRRSCPAGRRRRRARSSRARLDLPVEVDNDANLGALGEVDIGRRARALGRRLREDLVRDRRGLVLGGRVYRGRPASRASSATSGRAPRAPLCRCGNRGCLETVASTGAVLALLRPAHGDGLTSRGDARAGRRGDLGAARVIADAGRAVGRVLADVCNDLNPARS